MMNGSNDNSIYKCSSDCCSIERQQRHNHSHFNHSGSNNNNKRKQKTKHHHRQNNKGNNQKHQHSPQEPQFHNHGVVTPDQNHANYEYIIGDESHCDDDENSCNLGKVTISENEETTEHDEDDIGNSYSCDDTLTDDAVLSGGNHRCANHKSLKENSSENSRGSGGSGDGETCCSCSDESCVYEEPPSHPIQVNNKNQVLRVGEEN